MFYLFIYLIFIYLFIYLLVVIVIGCFQARDIAHYIQFAIKTTQCI